jgi:hypothetical protein
MSSARLTCPSRLMSSLFTSIRIMSCVCTHFRAMAGQSAHQTKHTAQSSAGGKGWSANLIFLAVSIARQQKVPFAIDLFFELFVADIRIRLTNLPHTSHHTTHIRRYHIRSHQTTSHRTTPKYLIGKHLKSAFDAFGGEFFDFFAVQKAVAVCVVVLPNLLQIVGVQSAQTPDRHARQICAVLW